MYVNLYYQRKGGYHSTEFLESLWITILFHLRIMVCNFFKTRCIPIKTYIQSSLSMFFKGSNVRPRLSWSIQLLTIGVVYTENGQSKDKLIKYTVYCKRSFEVYDLDWKYTIIDRKYTIIRASIRSYRKYRLW